MSARALVAALIGAVVIGCGGGGGGGSSSGGAGGPLGGGSSSNVPSGLSKCPQVSGDVTKISDKDTQGEYQYQQKQGATGGDIEVYADSSGNCLGMPDVRHGSAKILASAVITFKDASSAQKATGGMFGVNAGSNSAAVKGSSSGYGSSGVYVYSASEAMVVWTSGSKAIGILGENVSESDFKNFANGVKSQNSPN